MLSCIRIGMAAAVLLFAVAERSEAQRARFSGAARVGFGGGRLGFGGNRLGFGRGFYPFFPYWPGLYDNPYYGNPYSGGYYPGNFGYPVYNSYANYYPTVSYGGPQIMYVVSTPTASAPVEPGKPAKIEVKLPANAALWFDGKQSTQTGASRRFATPPLYPNALTTYELRASWTDESGAVMIRRRRIEVQPGENSVVDMTASEG